MIAEPNLPVENRILQLLRHLNIAQAHFAACLSRDWSGLITSCPDAVASLTLVCPWGMKIDDLKPHSPRLLIVTGDRGRPAEEVLGAVKSLPETTVLRLRDYLSFRWADVIADRNEEIRTAMTEFLSHIELQHPVDAIHPEEGAGEIAGITYDIQGSGPPLVLLPLALAPSQWEPLLPALREKFCIIRLGGAALGMVAFLEARGAGYLRVVRSLVDETNLRPGERALEVGCGAGTVVRWLARHTKGANRIDAVDVNSYLLREAAALAKLEGVDGVIEFRHGDAQALPFPENVFEVTIACTVMEEVDAERSLAECARVTRSGGRVGIIVRSLDMPLWVNLPLNPALKKKAEAPRGGVADKGCADASLYRLMRQAGLVNVVMLPQWATFSSGERLASEQERIMAALAREEVEEWQEAIVQAKETFFISQPFHCAVGIKP